MRSEEPTAQMQTSQDVSSSPASQGGPCPLPGSSRETTPAPSEPAAASHLWDHGASSKSLILVAKSDKQAEAEDYRKLGNKEKEKRQQDKKYSSTTAVRRRNLKGSGRAAQHFGGGLPGYTNPTPRSQFLPSVSELTPATRPCGRKCPGANTPKLFHM